MEEDTTAYDREAAHYMHERKALQEIEQRMSFSYGLESSLTDEERAADVALRGLIERDGLKVKGRFNAAIRDFHENFPILRSSQLYRLLDTMPKGALHHLHSNAGPTIENYLKLTYHDCVYFSERERLFKVAPKGLDEDGYFKCNDLRKFSSDPQQFDDKLRNHLKLLPEQYASKSSYKIWGHFQHKFALIAELSKFKPFFATLLEEVLMTCVKQNIYVVELRYSTGYIFDEEQHLLDLPEELQLIEGVLAKVRTQCSLDENKLNLRLILSGYKVAGFKHIQGQIASVIAGRTYSNLISGFDMVNIEDGSPPILSFAPEILHHERIACYLHCGETQDRANRNVVDALLLGSKRLGHAFQLNLQPGLMKVVKERDVCIEVCPTSNLLLGYVCDLRTHPVRFMLARGLQASISSDGPCFFGNEGVTMDYLLVYIAWELSLRDLKQLCINGIKYASIDEPLRKQLLEVVFPKDWEKWIRSVVSHAGRFA